MDHLGSIIQTLLGRGSLAHANREKINGGVSSGIKILTNKGFPGSLCSISNKDGESYFQGHYHLFGAKNYQVTNLPGY